MKKIVNRLIQSILTMFLVSVLCFALTKAAPGDPVMTYVEPNMSEQYIENLRESLGLNKPLPEQYFLWLGRILQGNFGNSLMSKRPVLTQILERLPATVILMGSSMVLGFLIAVLLGLYSGKNRNGIIDNQHVLLCRHIDSYLLVWNYADLSVQCKSSPASKYWYAFRGRPFRWRSDLTYDHAMRGSDFCKCVSEYPLSAQQYDY